MTVRQVFISYSSKDQPQADAVRNVIEQNGITCWMAPRDIPGGSNYTKEIPSAIRDCHAFVLMLSQNAQNSPWVLKELDRAVNDGKIILPFQLEALTLTDEFNFLLTGAQRYDAYQKKSEAMQLLISRLHAIIQTAPQTDEPASRESEKEHEPEPRPIFVSPEKKQTQDPEFSDSYGAVFCPACGSLDVQRLKGKIKPRDLMENLVWIGTLLVGLIVFPIAVFLIADSLYYFVYFATDWDDDIYQVMEFLVSALSFAAVFVGPWLATVFSKEWIRRRRIRSHKAVEEYRCNHCRMQFLPGDEK